MNGTGRHRLLQRGRLPYLSLNWSSYRDRKQSRGCGTSLHQLTALESSPPLEHLVSVQPMSPCHQRHARARLQRQLNNLPLLCNRPPSANPTSRPFCLIHDHIVRLKPAGIPEGKTKRLRFIPRTIQFCRPRGARRTLPLTHNPFNINDFDA